MLKCDSESFAGAPHEPAQMSALHESSIASHRSFTDEPGFFADGAKSESDGIAFQELTAAAGAREDHPHGCSPAIDKFSCPRVKEYSGLLSQLKFGQVIQKIKEINVAAAARLGSASTIALKKFEAVSEDALSFKLPRIIVIGDEKCGKSSTIERIAMAPVFPREDQVTTTRQPILLKLRYSSQHSYSSPLYTLTVPTCTDARGCVYNQSSVCDRFESTDSDEIISRVRRQMQAIEQSGVGIESESEIVIEMRSNCVPSVDMVDLPGDSIHFPISILIFRFLF
jgi:hypothetical protein